MSFLSSTGGVIGEWTAALRTGGSTGRFGPSLSQARSGLSITTDTSDFDESTYTSDTSLFDVLGDGIQKIVIPGDGIYRIEVRGAQGAHNAFRGGFGAVLSGEIDLSEGDELYTLVGQQGFPQFDDSSCRGIGGSGGTYVSIASPSGTSTSWGPQVDPVIIAGAGGSASRDVIGAQGRAGQFNDGTPSCSPANRGGTGAGFSTDGNQCQSNGVAQSFVNGGVAGPGQEATSGFGGGGGDDSCSSQGGPGGMFGGESWDSDSNAGNSDRGAGSFAEPSMNNVSRNSGANVDDGEITIEFLE